MENKILIPKQFKSKGPLPKSSQETEGPEGLGDMALAESDPFRRAADLRLVVLPLLPILATRVEDGTSAKHHQDRRRQGEMV